MVCTSILGRRGETKPKLRPTLPSLPSQRLHQPVATSTRYAAYCVDGLLTNVLQPWSQLGGQIMETTAAITNSEKDIFNSLREKVCAECISIASAFKVSQVKAFTVQLRHNARITDELDVALGFANLAIELRLVRPLIKDE